MAKKPVKQQERRELTGLERLGLRVSTMISSPKAQLDRRVTIHRLDTDEDDAWNGVMELLAEEEALEMTFNDDGTVTLRWGAGGDEERPAGEGDAQEESNVEEVPF